MPSIRYDSHTVIDTDSLNVEQLENWHIICLSDVEKIERQMHQNGESGRTAMTDPAWYQRASFALKARQRAADELLRVIVHRQELARRQAAQARTISYYFMEVCRQRMAADTFARVLEIASEEMARAEQRPAISPP